MDLIEAINETFQSPYERIAKNSSVSYTILDKYGVVIDFFIDKLRNRFIASSTFYIVGDESEHEIADLEFSNEKDFQTYLKNKALWIQDFQESLNNVNDKQMLRQLRKEFND